MPSVLSATAVAAVPASRATDAIPSRMAIISYTSLDKKVVVPVDLVAAICCPGICHGYECGLRFGVMLKGSMRTQPHGKIKA